MGEQQRHLLGAEHYGQTFGRRDAGHPVAEAGPPEGDVEEEAQRRAGEVHAGIAGAQAREIKLVAPQVLGLGLVRRPAEEGGELGDLADIIALGMRTEPADGRVLNHPLPQRADGWTCAGRIL